MQYAIRLEQPDDYRKVEELTREAFWNLHSPGCDEHYLLHTLRGHPDFIPELDFVALDGDRLVGNIAFSRSFVLNGSQTVHKLITFGPLSVLPAYQNRGVGTALVLHAIQEARAMGYHAIVIFGDPAYYGRFGFRSVKAFGISDSTGRYPIAHQALELYDNALANISGRYRESEAFGMDADSVAAFDRGFPPKEKKHMASQDTFQRIAGTYL